MATIATEIPMKPTSFQRCENEESHAQTTRAIQGGPA